MALRHSGRQCPNEPVPIVGLTSLETAAEVQMSKATPKELFGFITRRVRDLGNAMALEPYRAFPYWFAKMYHSQPEGVLTSDGTGDGKVDFFFHTVSGSDVTYHVINSKYTETYGQTAPVSFYDE